MSSQDNKHETNRFKVKIKADALIRMMTHVLRFGNEAFDESFEVMGVCIGEIDETSNVINLINVNPIQHGIHVSTGFSKEDVELFAGLNKEYQEKDMKIEKRKSSRVSKLLKNGCFKLDNRRSFYLWNRQVISISRQ